MTYGLKISIIILSIYLIIGLLGYVGIWGYTSIDVFLLLLILPLVIELYNISRIKSELPFILKGSTIFILSYVIVNFQGFIEAQYGSASVVENILIGNQIVNIKAFYISFAGLIGFIIGNSFSINRNKSQIKISPKSDISLYPLYFLNYLFLLLYVKEVGSVYINGGYGIIDLKSKGVRYSLILELTYYALLYFIIKKNDIKKRSIIKAFSIFGINYWLSLILYLTLMMFAGDRGPILYLSLATLLVMIYLNRIRLKNSILIIIASILIVSISIFGLGRKYGAGKNLSDKFQIGIEKFVTNNDDTLSPATIELAGSGRCNIAAVQIVDNSGYFNGRLLLQQVLGTVPFLGAWYYDWFDIPYEEYNSANLITYKVLGDSPTYGLGSSCVADLYLDFGIWGVIIGLLLFGLLMRFIDDNIDNLKMLNSFVLCIFLIFYSKSYYIPRSYISYEFRFILWLYIIIIIYNYIFGTQYSKKLYYVEEKKITLYNNYLGRWGSRTSNNIFNEVF